MDFTNPQLKNTQEEEKKIVIIPQFSDMILEIPSTPIKDILPFPDHHICILFKDQSYQCWSLIPQKILKEGFLEFTYITIESKGAFFIAFITQDFKLRILNMLTGEKQEKFDWDFLENQEKDDSYLENILKIEKSSVNQLAHLFEMTYLENFNTLCVLLRKTLKEDSMNYTLYLFQEEKPPIITQYSQKNTLFLRLFNLQQKYLLLFDLMHDNQKNPQMIFWKRNPEDPNILQETTLKLNRWFTGTLISIMLWSQNEIAVFGNFNGIRNPNFFLINIESGEMRLQKFNPFGFYFDPPDWLFNGVILQNLRKNVTVFEMLDLNRGLNVIVKNNEKIYKIESDSEENWKSSGDGELIIGYKNAEKNGVLIRMLHFVEKKVAIFYFLEKTGVFNRYGSFISREILEFL